MQLKRKEVAPVDQNSLIHNELATFFSLLFSAESPEHGIFTNATARLWELVYDAIINSFAGGNMTDLMLFKIKGKGPWVQIMPNRNLSSNSHLPVEQIGAQMTELNSCVVV